MKSDILAKYKGYWSRTLWKVSTLCGLLVLYQFRRLALALVYVSNACSHCHIHILPRANVSSDNLAERITNETDTNIARAREICPEHIDTTHEEKNEEVAE